MMESQRSHSTTELVAFHKRKRIFLKLKDLAREDPSNILICEFNGQDFELVADKVLNIFSY
jgi:hypothetical protein